MFHVVMNRMGHIEIVRLPDLASVYLQVDTDVESLLDLFNKDVREFLEAGYDLRLTPEHIESSVISEYFGE